ncbi:2-oxo-4-hydroxy-4-carboxy-5-ureidoimidazoline decarboxylase [Hydrogenophaga sp.]|uniref:2-oxo-4-hydroxy-4-carboxy-5-ureidoimidazoline decarboxylase n=1 Tax=Hydrogenophaga sp. TaxID=1904254 RepID=UPI002601EAA6|nr:2-oxo-4-hydroxy-4-carboxy-5-ureidoimidazoline decarboxylase [Hydrogenophaga sp.]MCW5652587.1 2-oxo-4-hydroxy-4-carboxy-5-ureidoimidazoline decarboxylase [Hydrogenophaga sp.]
MNTSRTPPLNWSAFAALDREAFSRHLASVVEHAPWVAQRAWARRPFADWQALFEAMSAEIQSASDAEQLGLLRGHPELAGQEARAGTMTPDSQGEQGRLGLLALDAETVQRIDTLNQRYRSRFGFPFIVALRLHPSLASVLQAFDERSRHDPDTERREALHQVCEVMRGRLAHAVATALPTTDSPSAPPPAHHLAGNPS